MADILREARSIQNRTSPVGKLPSELLSVVFRMIQDDLLIEMDIPRDLNEDSVRYFQWTRVIRVCRRWRTVAISSAVLWNTIMIPRRPATPSLDARTHIRRSAECPLTVFMNVTAAPSEVFKALTQMHRIRELIIEVDCHRPSKMSLSLPLIWCRPAPQLRVLTFVTPKTSLLKNRELPKLFSGQLDYLPSLCLTRISGSSQYNYSSLRHLHLHNLICVLRRSVQSLFDLLAATPVLEDLMFTLFNGEPDGEPFLQENRPSVELPRLRRLAFMQGARGVEALLSHLHIPAGVSMSFSLVAPLSTWANVDIVPRNLTRMESLRDLHDFEFRFSADSVITVRAVGDASAFFAQWRCPWFRGVGPEFWAAPWIASLARRLWLYLPSSQSYGQRARRRKFLQLLGATASNVRTLFVTGDKESMVADVEAMLGNLEVGVSMKNLDELHLARHMSDDYGTLQLALSPRKGIRRMTLYEAAPCEGVWEGHNPADTRNPAWLRRSVPVVSVVTGSITDMEWVDICSSPSDAPWDWPVWTKDGGCSIEYDSDIDIDSEMEWTP